MAICRTPRRKLLDQAMFKLCRGIKGVVLDVGAGASPYSQLPQVKSIRLDIDKSSHKVDVVADAHHLPIRGRSVNAVICTEVLEHLEKPGEALEEVRRVLVNDGVLILSTPFLYPLHDEKDYWRITPRGVRRILEELGFSVDLIESQGGLFTSVGSLIHVWGERFPPLIKYPLWLFAHLLSRLDRGCSEAWTTGYVVVARKPCS